MPGFQHTGVDVYQTYRTKRDIWMTGCIDCDYGDCCVHGDVTACDGVMVEVHFFRQVVYICRTHLDLFGDMIIHTRQLREADSAEGS